MKKIKSRLLLLAGAIVLLNFWLLAIAAIRRGTIFAYQSYWGAPLEKYTLVVILLFATPAYFVLVWRDFFEKPKSQSENTIEPSVLKPISQQLYRARTEKEKSKTTPNGE